MSDITLVLGGITFSGHELPEHIPFPIKQHIVKHELPGGRKVVDALGAFDEPIEWSGWFTGSNATDRAIQLQALCRSGLPQLLTWGQLSYTVVVSEFAPDFERWYQIPYRITCEVVQNNTQPATPGATASPDEAINADATAAVTQAGEIGNGPLSEAVGAVQSATAAVSKFATATTATLNSVLQPIADAKARVGVLIASAENTIQNIATVGGVVPGNPIAKQVANMSAQINAVTSLPQLTGLNGVLGRMSANINTVGTGSKTVTTAGGNLMTIASQQYGDAGQWAAIAKANGLSDPLVTGVAQLKIPAAPTDTGGVLNV